MFTGVEDGALPGIMAPAAPSLGRSAPPPAAPEDRVFELLMTQRADGSFGESSVLERWLGPARSTQLRAACAQHDASVVITQLVIALLVREAPERESEWRPAVDKAKAYCAQRPSPFDAASLL